MKMEPTEIDRPIQEEPLSSTVNTSTGTTTSSATISSNGAPPLTYDPDKTEIISASMWNSVQGKLGKAGSVTTPDGKKIHLFNYFNNF